MKINQIQNSLNSQMSTMNAFPSQRHMIEEMHQPQNQRATLEVQIETFKLLKSQEETLQRLTQVVGVLSDTVRLQQEAAQNREVVDDTRYIENTRLSRIAAWSGVISVITGSVLAVIGLWAQFKLVETKVFKSGHVALHYAK